MIKGLHHNAYRCRDSEETRRFYEDFLGLPLAGTLAINETKTGPQDRTCCTRSTGWTTARSSRSSRRRTRRSSSRRSTTTTCTSRSKSTSAALHEMFAKGKARGIETRGVIDHGFIHSIYFRDPNGYVVELTAKTARHAQEMDPATNGARAKLDRWQAEKAR